MRLPALTVVLALLAAAPALGFFEARSVSGDLDGDGVREQARTVRVQADPAQPPDDGLDGVQVNVSDPSCGIDVKVAGPQESLGHMKLVRADTRPGRELLIDLRSGATGRGGETRLVAWRPDAGGCGSARQLFRYVPNRPTRRPRGTTDVAGFGITVRELERRFAGRELMLFEGWVTRRDAFCCPSVQKRSYFRYDRVKDRYVRYFTRVTRVTDPAGAEFGR